MPKKEKIGQIISAKMDHTLVVQIQEYKPHPKYKKIIGTTKKYKAHYENLECAVGDEVKLIENRPLSKTKLWKAVEITKKAT
ncbi:MAG TPA: 30S ribosomal protein S17 [Candidatus Gastranaerophilales bacterium]|nr:30S ribosomal protein S17 [Candidatus Gastranaerophilales bacterium]